VDVVEGNITILVLDDEEIICSRLKPALEKEGYAVETCTDSREAKRRLETRRFDVVVTDLRMAGVDGMEILRFVKRRWPGTEVVLISGYATPEVMREAMKAGAREVVEKPFRIRDFKALIDEVARAIGTRNSGGDVANFGAQGCP